MSGGVRTREIKACSYVKIWLGKLEIWLATRESPLRFAIELHRRPLRVPAQEMTLGLSSTPRGGALEMKLVHFRCRTATTR
jgi:hypothetical protein